MTVSSSILRLTWAVVEETSRDDLLTFSDTALIRFLLQRIAKKILLDGEELCALYDYLGTKLCLIRDIAESRLTHESSFRDVLV